MNKYRVDRARETYSPPVGMSSILYVGDNLTEALDVYHAMTGGKDAWNVPHPEYGVMLSIWDDTRREYIVKRWKNK